MNTKSLKHVPFCSLLLFYLLLRFTSFITGTVGIIRTVGLPTPS